MHAATAGPGRAHEFDFNTHHEISLNMAMPIRQTAMHKPDGAGPCVPGIGAVARSAALSGLDDYRLHPTYGQARNLLCWML